MPEPHIPDAQRAALTRAALTRAALTRAAQLVESDVLLGDQAWLDEDQAAKAKAGNARAKVHGGLPVKAMQTMRYVPYLFMRELRGESPVQNEWGIPSLQTKLPYVAFMQRHQSRWSPYWEDGDCKMRAFDFKYLLRSIFVVQSGSDDEQELIRSGEVVAAELNRLEDERGCVEALALGDCEDLIDGWPSFEAPRRIPLFAVAHNFDAWNHSEHVWQAIRKTPVEFTPIPEEDVALLNKWLFARYRFPRSVARFRQELENARTTAKRHNSPRKLVAEGMLEAMANSSELIRFVQER